MKSIFLHICLGLFGSILFAQNQPNIVFILADDLGYADVGFNGSTDIPTPEMDQLAANGTICSSAYVVHPFCGPSRAGLLTGRYAHEIGAQFNLPNTGTGSELGVPTDQKFMSKMLQEAGYRTGLVGKWHLGKESQYHPNVRGFDDFYGFLGGGHEYFPDHYKQEYANGSNWDYNFPMEHNGVEVTDDDEYITDELSHEGVRFIQESVTANEPFFLFMSYNAPHTPLRAKTEDLAVTEIASITDPNRKTYAAMVYALDRGVGELVDELQAQNVYDNTLIIFLSDNGGRTDSGANNAPLSGVKGNTLEGGFRVPMFWHWPNNVPIQTTNHVISALDLYPTFAHLAGANVSGNANLDGKNIWTDLIANQDPREGEPIFALRHNNSAHEIGLRRDQWKLHKFNTGNWKLYDLDADISETTDLSSQYPELTDTLIAITQNWTEDHVEPLWFHDQTASDAWTANSMPNYDATFGTVIDLGGEYSLPLTDQSNTGNWVYNEQVSDEFNDAALNENKWLIQGRNGEYQSNWIGRAPSQFSTENVRLEDGKMKLETRWEPDYNFSETPQADGTVYENITTAAVIAKEQFLYGYMEIKCKAADAEITSSFWTTGFESELDMFEFFGDHRIANKESQGYDKQYKWQYIDWSPGLTTRRVYGEEYILPWRVADDFHVYGTEWDPEFIKFYADGVLIGSITKDQMEALGNEWVMTNPQWIWFDQETFPWNGIPEAAESGEFPVDYEIEYIRVWQKENNNILDEALFGFEGPLRKDGAWKYWTISGTSANHMEIVDDRSVVGNRSLKIHHANTLGADITANSPTGSVEIAAGDYTLSAKLWLESGVAPDRISVAFGDAGEDEVFLSTTGIPSGQWVNVNTSISRVSTSSSTDKIRLRVYSVDASTAAELFIEDIRIVPNSGIYEGSVWDGFSWDVTPPAENARLKFEADYNNSGNLKAEFIKIDEGIVVTIPSGSSLQLTGDADFNTIAQSNFLVDENFEAATIPAVLDVSGEAVSLVSDIQGRASQVLAVSGNTDGRVFYEFEVTTASDYRLSFKLTTTNSYHFTRLEKNNGAVEGTLISSGSGLSDWTDLTQDYALSPGTYYLRLQSSTNAAQAIYVDDIKVEDLHNTAPSATNSQLVISSGASLIVPDNFNEVVTFERNTSFGDAECKYSFVGSPVQSSPDIIGSDLGADVYEYNETIAFDADDGLSRWEDASSNQLIPGIGYTQTSQEKITFQGIPNTGSITVTGLSKTTNGTVDPGNQGWHLLSNPFGAAIDLSSFLAGNSAAIEGSIRLWDDGTGTNGGKGNGGSYLTANTIASVGGPTKNFEGYIGSMQGFFVKVLNDGVDVVFSQDMLVVNQNDDSNFFRKDNVQHGVKMILSDGQYEDELFVGLSEDATSGYDHEFDATKLMANNELQFYSLIDSDKLAIQTINEFESDHEVKLGYLSNGEKTLNLRVTDLNLKDKYMTLYLKDHKTGTTIELADSKTYSFSGKNGISSNQLSLIYRDDSTLGLDDEVLDFDFKVLEQGLELDFGKSMHVSGYAIYDISGKILLHVSEDINVRTLNVLFHEKGMYILRLQTSTGITNWKFVR